MSETFTRPRPCGPVPMLTTDLVAEVERLMPALVYTGPVADQLGFSRRTMRRWLSRARKARARLEAEGDQPRPDEVLFLALLTAVEKGRVALRSEALAAVVRAFKEQGVWQAACWVLERVFPEHFGASRNEIVAMKRQMASIEKEMRQMVR